MAQDSAAPMAVLTPDSETSEVHAYALDLVQRGRTPDEVCERLPATGTDGDALWLYSWALAQRRDERALPRAALPPVADG